MASVEAPVRRLQASRSAARRRRAAPEADRRRRAAGRGRPRRRGSMSGCSAPASASVAPRSPSPRVHGVELDALMMRHSALATACRSRQAHHRRISGSTPRSRPRPLCGERTSGREIGKALAEIDRAGLAREARHDLEHSRGQALGDVENLIGGPHSRRRRPCRNMAVRTNRSPDPRGGGYAQRGARLARIRCDVRRCIASRRAVSDTLRLHSS